MIHEHRKKSEWAVSPVVGIMLMLVVTIIIAAVVSAFAGGISSGQSKAPSIGVSTHIRNDGTYAGSFIEFAVTSVDSPIQTRDLKISTSWTTTNKSGNGTVTGGTTVTGTWTNLTNMHYGASVSSDYYAYQAPVGYGAGVNRSSVMIYPSPYSYTDSVTGKTYTLFNYPDQMFGNYTLMGGTIMRASPGNYGYADGTYDYYGIYQYVGNGRYNYAPEGNAYNVTSDVDGMQAMLGKGWENLRAGDTVKVVFMHIPSGKAIYNEKVSVEGGDG